MQSLSSKPWTGVRTANGRWEINVEFANAQFIERLERPATLVAPPAIPLRKDQDQRANYLARLSVPEFPDRKLIVKRYRYLAWWQAAKDIVRPARGLRSFHRAFYLRRQNVATATPVAAGEIRRGGWPRESYLISEEVPDSRPLRELRREPVNRREGQVLARRLGEVMADLHNARLSHSDPSLSNFLVSGRDPASFRIVVIDVDALRPCSSVTRRRAVRNLRRLLERAPMSPDERLWLVARYCRGRSPRWSARELLSWLGDRR